MCPQWGMQAVPWVPPLNRTPLEATRQLLQFDFHGPNSNSMRAGWLWLHYCQLLSSTSALRYSDKYPFRMRSETPDIAIELSMQPLRAFRPDGIIFFSDILTPLPGGGAGGRKQQLRPVLRSYRGAVQGRTCRGMVAMPHPPAVPPAVTCIPHLMPRAVA